MSNAKKLKVSSKELKNFLKHIITNNQFLQEKGDIPLVVEVEGPAGIGKTSAVLQLGKELNLPVAKVNLATIEELGDLVGYPIRQFQMCNADGCVWIDEHAIEDYRKMDFKFTGKKRMSYCPPEWIADKEEGGILFLDDFSRADVRFVQATMELIDRQEYISWKLPKNWHIILSTNPDDGDYNVTSMDAAQRGRFLSVQMKFDMDCWSEWAESAGVDGRCINFVLMHPEVMNDKVDPRSVVKFFNGISSIKSFVDELDMIEMVGEASIGQEFATTFALFINNKLDKLIPPKTILTHKDYDKVKETLRATIGKDSTYRADIAAVLSRRIMNYALFMVKEKQMNSATIDRIMDLMTEDIFTDDLKYFVVNQLFNQERAVFQKMLLNPKVAKMAVK